MTCVMVDVCYDDRSAPVSVRLTDDMCYGGCVLWWMYVMVDVCYDDRPAPLSVRLTDDMCYGGCVL